jgi:TldD protein
VSAAIDREFLALPARQAASAALEAATAAGAAHVDVRVERLRGQDLALRNARLERLDDRVTVGIGVRVVHDGTWGFAGGPDVTVDEAVRLARAAVDVARTSRPLNTEPVELADEPVYDDVTWVSAYDVDPFGVDPARRWRCWPTGPGSCSTRATSPRRRVAGAGARGQVLRRLRGHHDDAAAGAGAAPADRHAGGSGRRLRDDAHAGAAGRPRLGVPHRSPLRLAGELAELPSLLAEKAAARSVEPGRYDLVIDPTNLWLTIHESVGHATELDRALGYEAAYAGTSFATLDQLGPCATARRSCR